MNAIWDRFKWLLTHVSWVIAGLIALIDPKHIDELAKNHPAWSALILLVWGALLAWANKTKPPAEPTVYPPGTGADPVTHQNRNPQNKPYTGGLR